MKRSPSVCSVKCRVPASTRRHIERRLTQARAAACSALIMGTCSPHDGHQAWTKTLGLLMASSCRVSMAVIKFRYDWDWAGAESEFKRAIALNQNYSTAHQ